MQSHGRTIVCIVKQTSPDLFRGAVATWPGKGKSKKQVAHTIRGHQSPRFKDNPGASEAKPCYYQGDSQHCQEDLEPTDDLGLPAAVAQPPKPWHQHRQANVVRDRAEGLSGNATVLGPRSHNGMETQSKIHRCRMAGPCPLVRGV